jgi:outer membrane protein TolC
MANKYRYFFIIPFLFFICFLARARAEEVLSWQDCVKEAAKNHPDLIAAQQTIKQSEASKTITASTLFPQVNSSLSGSTARTDNGITNSASDNYTYGVSGTQLLFDGAKTFNNVRAASENIKASKESFRFTSSQVRFRLRTAFVNLLRAQESLKITQDIFDIRRSNLELITLRYESGQEHKGALLTAEANLAEAQYQISQAKRSVEVAQRDLVKEMGRMSFTPMQVSGNFDVTDAAKEKPDFEALAKNNPSLMQIIAQKKAADFGLKSAYANFSPTLSGQAGANRTSKYWTPKNDEWNLGLTLSMPVFEGGLRFAQVAQAKALLGQLRENERSTRDAAVLTLEQTWAALQDAIENVYVQKKNLTANEERTKIADAEYSIGFITFDNWTIIQDNLVSAKQSFLNAEANALLAEASWIEAKGETVEYAKN